MAVSTIQREIIVKDYTVTTTSNSGVSPFGAYVQFDATPVSGYTPISSEVTGIGSGNPTFSRLCASDSTNDIFFIYGKSAGTFGLRVVYKKN